MKARIMLVVISYIPFIGLWGCSMFGGGGAGKALPRVDTETLRYGNPEAALVAYEEESRRYHASGFTLLAEKNNAHIADLQKIVERKHAADSLYRHGRFEDAFETYRQLQRVWPRGDVATRVLELSYILARKAQLEGKYELALTYYAVLTEGLFDERSYARLPSFLAAQIALCYYSSAAVLLEKSRAAAGRSRGFFALGPSESEKTEAEARVRIRAGLVYHGIRELATQLQAVGNRRMLMETLSAAIAKLTPLSEPVAAREPMAVDDPAAGSVAVVTGSAVTRSAEELARIRELAATTVSPAIQRALTARITEGSTRPQALRSGESTDSAPASTTVALADHAIRNMRSDAFRKMAVEDYAGALQVFEEIQRQRPADATINSMVTSIRERLTVESMRRQATLSTEIDVRIKLMEDIVRQFPESPDAPRALWDLSGLYIQAQERDSARNALERLITLYPDSPFVENATARLSQM